MVSKRAVHGKDAQLALAELMRGFAHGFDANIARRASPITEPTRRYGVEVEWLFVDRKTGEPIDMHLREQVIKGIASYGEGWQAVDEHSLRKGINGNTATIGKELGKSIIELADVPSDRLSVMKAHLVENTRAIFDAVAPLEVMKLGTGLHPYAIPDERQIMQGPRYTAFKPMLGRNIYLHTITAAVHVHVEVGKEEVARVMNMLSAYVPIIAAIYANSPIYMGRDSGMSSRREYNWDEQYANYPSIVGIPPLFSGIEDVMLKSMDLPSYVTARSDDYLVYQDQPGTLRRFVDKGSTVARSVYDGRDIELTPTMEDLYTHLGTIRWNVRAREKTVELRIVDSQQSVDRIISLVGLVKGLVANMEKAEELAGQYSVEQRKEARADALVRGLDAQYAGEDIKEVASRMFRIAWEGLRIAHEPNPEVLAYPEFMVRTGRNVADVHRDAYRAMGREEFLKSLEFSLRTEPL